MLLHGLQPGSCHIIQGRRFNLDSIEPGNPATTGNDASSSVHTHLEKSLNLTLGLKSH